VNAFILSCAQRETARAQTIPQLEAAGLEVTVFLDACDPVGKGGNGGVGLRAIQHARTLGGPVLLVEDDIDLAPDFPYFLDAALPLGALTYFYLHDRPDRMKLHYGSELTDHILAGKPMPRNLVKVKAPVMLFGTQCVLIPPQLLSFIEAQLVTHPTAFDGNVQRAVDKTSWPVLVALPHPVQHRHDRTARAEDGKVKRSMSYDLPRLEP
jgi:hypothetical protein